ncbi:hypothetical protein [Streptomyces lannensis]|uniref:Uncharacterized protein n=1 Tax=Streptomyces lannensis TaxID=766498 RepID=A0ABP7LH85_9ACTN
MEHENIPTEPEPSGPSSTKATVAGIVVAVGTFLMGLGTLLSGIADLNRP